MWEKNQDGIAEDITSLEEVCWSDENDASSVQEILRSDGTSGDTIARKVFKPKSGDILSTIGRLGTESGVVYLKVIQSDEGIAGGVIAGGMLKKWSVELQFDDTPVECSAGYKFVFPTDCEPCPAGTYILAGQTTCQACPEGKFSTNQAAADPNACLLCEAGKYSTTTANDEAGDCLACRAGTFSTATGAASETACLDCLAGKYSSQVGATSCINCIAGKYAYSSSTGATSDAVCFECRAGKYSETLGAKGSAACSDCPAGSTSPSGSGSSELCRRCPSEFFLARDFPADECYIAEGAGWQVLE